MISKLPLRSFGALLLRNLSTTSIRTASTLPQTQKPYTVPPGRWGENRAARLELSAAYRNLNLLGLNEGVCNHLTCVAPAADEGSDEDVMLLIPYGQHWGQVSAGSLIGVNQKGEVVEGCGKPELSAACIHLGVRRMRPDARVVMHTHQPYTTAIACMQRPEILQLHQNSTRFSGTRVAVDKCYAGLADHLAEGERLGHVLGSADVLLMGAHGVLVAAPTVALGFDLLYYIERAAQLQILALSTGQELALIPAEVVKQTSDEYWKDAQVYADAHFYALYRQLQATQPDFQN